MELKLNINLVFLFVFVFGDVSHVQYVILSK